MDKIKSLFYESPQPPKKAVEPVVEISPLKKRVLSLIEEGVLFGNGRISYGNSPMDQRLDVGPALGGGGGYAGPAPRKVQPGETQFGIIEDDEKTQDPPEEKNKEGDADTSKDDASTPPKDDSANDVDTPTPPQEPEETPEQKITNMFTDTGDIDQDYSLTNENNIRLEKFKYTNIGLDLKKLIPEDELKTGISSKSVMNLLTPSQRDMMKDKNREFRKTYPLVDKREKNIIIHNSNVPIYNSRNSEKVELSNDVKRQAYDKINAYLEANFGKNWQDKTKAINFLRTIKINFADSPAIRANLIDIGSMVEDDGENYKIPLDKVNVLVPSIVQDFIKINKEDPTFSRSNIFRTLTSAYNQESGTKGQIYIIFDSENIEDNAQEDTEEDSEDDEDDSEDTETSDSSEETPSDGAETPAGEEVPTNGDESTPEDTSDAGDSGNDEGLENEVPPLPAG